VVAVGLTIALEDWPALLKSLPTRAASFVRLVPTLAWIGWGLALGVVFSAFTRNRKITFENIGYFDQDLFDPKLRYLFLVVVLLIVTVLLAKQWLIAGVTDSLLLNKFATDHGIAILLGILVGYAEPNITKLVTGTLDLVKTQAK
jgi:hypothetical protein